MLLRKTERYCQDKSAHITKDPAHDTSKGSLNATAEESTQIWQRILTYTAKESAVIHPQKARRHGVAKPKDTAKEGTQMETRKPD